MYPVNAFLKNSCHTTPTLHIKYESRAISLHVPVIIGYHDRYRTWKYNRFSLRLVRVFQNKVAMSSSAVKLDAPLCLIRCRTVGKRIRDLCAPQPRRVRKAAIDRLFGTASSAAHVTTASIISLVTSDAEIKANRAECGQRHDLAGRSGSLIHRGSSS